MKNPENWGVSTAQAWSIALIDLCMTQQEFATACQKSLGLAWFPTSPYDFLMLARSIDDKYPNMRQAYLDASNGNYTHAVIYETADRVGFWEIRTQAESATWKRWQQIYPQVCAEAMSGADFTLPKSHRLADKSNEHKPMQPDSLIAKKVDKFIKDFLEG